MWPKTEGDEDQRTLTRGAWLKLDQRESCHHSFSTKKSQSSGEEQLIPELGTRNFKMSPEHMLVLEREEVLKEWWGRVKKTQRLALVGSQRPDLG